MPEDVRTASARRRTIASKLEPHDKRNAPMRFNRAERWRKLTSTRVLKHARTESSGAHAIRQTDADYGTYSYKSANHHLRCGRSIPPLTQKQMHLICDPLAPLSEGSHVCILRRYSRSHPFNAQTCQRNDPVISPRSTHRYVAYLPPPNVRCTRGDNFLCRNVQNYFTSNICKKRK